MSSSDTLKIPYEEIEYITGNFNDEKVIGYGRPGEVYKAGLSKVYKARRSQSGESVNVVVRRVDHSFWMQDIAYGKEVSILSTLQHKNMVSLVGFCKNNEEMLVVYKDEAHGNLDKYLDDPEKLTWMRRLKISVGVSSALSSMHDHSVIHHNVNTETILIDENWEAKLSGFELSMRIPAEGDIDPAYEMIGIGTYKSDAYSFGIVLFEILCGKKAFVSNDQDNTFQTSLVKFHYEGRTLHKLVDPDLFSQMDPQSFNIFSATAYDCLKKRPPPNMNQVLGRLQKALKLQEKYENNEHSSTGVRIGPLSDQLKKKLKQLEHMRIQLQDIKSATNNFDREYCIMSGGFGMVYKTKLEHVDREYCIAKGENELGSMRRICSEVAVKRMFDEDESGEQGFYAEIDMLTSCKHSHIVTLFGFCNEGSAMILVYEYASNGSLVDYLTGKSKTTKDSWVQRMNICLQVAMGLSYLHNSEGDKKEIVHRDIKSANILLDENFDAKIGDFGLCEYYSENEEHNTLYSREIAGTKVYMDPQYAKEGKLRKELDIYCLGIVMFEMLCGRLAYDPFFSSGNNLGLAPTARRHFLKGTVEEIVDIRMKERNREQQPFISIKRLSSFNFFSKIAFQCLAEAQANRPTLEYVIKELREALPFQGFYDRVMRLKGNKIPKKEPNSPRN